MACWRSVLCCRCCCGCCGDGNVQSLTNGPHPVSGPNGALLVFVNPHSGAGKGVQVFRDDVMPRLLGSRVCFDLLITERPNHARDVVKTRDDLFGFNGIVIVSGDGLVFEVVNGILDRPDGEKLMKRLAFGIIPTGSGNGLLASLCFARNKSDKQPDFLQNAIESVSDLSTRAFAVNLTHIETNGPHRHFGSFMSIGWGLLADIDIESERFRSVLGSQRFFLGALIRVFGSLRSYRGKLSFVEAGPSEAPAGEQFGVYEKAARTSQCPSYQSARSSIAVEDACNLDETTDFWRTHHKMTPGVTVPSVGESLSRGWTTIDDDFLFVYITSVTHISPGNMYSPSAKLSDDRVYLTYGLKKDMPSRVTITKFLDSIKNSTHLEFDFCKSVPVTSFRLESVDAGSYMVVDGEVIDCTTIQGTVSDVNLFLMSK